MKNKRTNIDFKDHKHRVEIFKNDKDDEIRIDHFQVGDSNQRYIQFVNTDRLAEFNVALASYKDLFKACFQN